MENSNWTRGTPQRDIPCTVLNNELILCKSVLAILRKYAMTDHICLGLWLSDSPATITGQWRHCVCADHAFLVDHSPRNALGSPRKQRQRERQENLSFKAQVFPSPQRLSIVGQVFLH